MLGKLTQLNWTSGGGSNRDLAFVIVFLAFGLILVVKLAPYYTTHEQSVSYNKIQTTPSIPKSFLAQMALPFTGGSKSQSDRSVHSGSQAPAQTGEKRPSVLERQLFDGQVVTLRVRALNSYSSMNSGQPIEVQIIGPVGKESSEIDFTPAIGGKLLGIGSANLAIKKLNITFNELVSVDGRSYSIQGQAVESTNLAPGIEGDYSSGLATRLAGIALDRTIVAADQIGTGILFSALGPAGPNGQQLKTAAMETNQQASQNISAEATKSLREAQATIELRSGSVFLVRLRATQQGGHP